MHQDERYKDGMTQGWIDQIQQAWIITQATGRCLHVGCGQKPIEWAVNIDPNPDRSPWADHDYNVCDLPFSDDRFDSIVSSHVLPAVQDLYAAMYEMARVLKPGGYMAHVIPNWMHAPARLSPRFPWQYQHQGWYSPQDFEEYMETYGDIFRVELCESFPDFEFSFRVRAIRL